MRKWRQYSKQNYGRRYQLEAFEKEAGNLPGYQSLGQWASTTGAAGPCKASSKTLVGGCEQTPSRKPSSAWDATIQSAHDRQDFQLRPQGRRSGRLGLPRPARDARRSQRRRAARRDPHLPATRGRRQRISEQRRNAQTLVPRRRFRRYAAADVYELLAPSPERALALNKAYKTIVEDQDFVFGRDATIRPPQNVYESIDNSSTPTLPEDRTYTWNILLDWSTAQPSLSEHQP